MGNIKTLQTERVITTVDSTTGEQLSTSTLTSQKYEQEPDFVKMYLEDLVKLKDLPKSCDSLLNVLLRYMTYENKIILNKFFTQGDYYERLHFL